MRQPDLVRIGAGFAFFNVGIVDNMPVLTNEYLGSTPPNIILQNFIWPATGAFLGETATINFDVAFNDVEESTDLVNGVTDEYLENYKQSITMQLAYNGVVDVADLFYPPENNNSGIRTGGLSVDPYEGNLLILISNLRNNVPSKREIVRLELYPRVKVIPGKRVVNGGHTYIDAKFKVLVPNGEDGCPLSYTYIRWLVSIYAPNTMVGSDGTPINTMPDIMMPIGNNMWVNTGIET